ncbi:MAG: serine/threonine-protein kinase [Planctomycetota bacterium]
MSTLVRDHCLRSDMSDQATETASPEPEGESQQKGTGWFKRGLFGPFRAPKQNAAAVAKSDAAEKDGAASAPSDKMDGVMDETTLGQVPASSRSMSFTFTPGSQPLPPYTIRRGVGAGGFGEVYFAVSQAGKEVALKRIQRNLDVEIRGVSQCLNLKHPNLVSLYDICNGPDGGSWVVMEYVAGDNLRDLLDRNPDGLGEMEARRWFAGIAAGVDHLHNAGLVHRDLKPGNVFDDLGTVKVGDYGLSKFISTSQRGGHTESVGTFHYMAPEIGRGQYGREIDVYALGIMLYELLTGRVPFDGESCHEIIVKHMTSVPDLSGVGEPYRSVIARSLDKDPNRRPSSVSEMIQPLGLSASEAVQIPTLNSSESQPAANRSGRRSEPVARSQPVQPIPVATPVTPSRPSASPRPGVSDEPVLRAVKKSASDIGTWWKSLEHSPRARFWIAALLAFIVFINTQWLLPLMSMLAAVYVPYYVIRHMVLHAKEQPSYARAHEIASQTVPAQPTRLKTRNEWRSEVRHTLRAKPSLVRMAELNTSWIAASLTILAMAAVSGVIGLRTGDITAAALAPYFWVGLIALVGSQGILFLGKLWERDEGEGLPRRLVLAGVGAAVGLAAYGLNEFLMLPLQVGESMIYDGDLPQALYRGDGTIRAAGMMAHFALLLGAIRWWRPVDPLRRTRLSLWSVAVVCVAAWGVQHILPMPQPTGILVAGALAVATQMSAPWINPRQLRSRVSSQNPSEVRA